MTERNGAETPRFFIKGKELKIKAPESLIGSAGEIGNVWFDEHGVSAEISAEVARRFLAVFGGSIVSEFPEGVSTLDQCVVHERRELELELGREEQERMKFRKDLGDYVVQVPERKKPALGLYSREGLSALADKGGIKPLREVGDKFGVKAQSIGKLIDEILEAQDAQLAAQDAE